MSSRVVAVVSRRLPLYVPRQSSAVSCVHSCWRIHPLTRVPARPPPSTLLHACSVGSCLCCRRPSLGTRLFLCVRSDLCILSWGAHPLETPVVCRSLFRTPVCITCCVSNAHKLFFVVRLVLGKCLRQGGHCRTSSISESDITRVTRASTHVYFVTTARSSAPVVSDSCPCASSVSCISFTVRASLPGWQQEHGVGGGRKPTLFPMLPFW